MNSRQLLPGHGQHTERIMRTQIVFDRKRKARQIGQMLKIGRVHPLRIEGRPIVRYPRIRVHQQRPQARKLQRRKLIPRRPLDRLHRPTSITHAHPPLA